MLFVALQSLGASPLLPDSNTALDGRHELEGDVPFGEAQAQRHGWTQGERCSESDQLSLSFMLRHSEDQEIKLRGVLLAVSDPSSQRYGQHLTREQLATVVSTPEAVAAVSSFLRENGVDESLITASPTADSLTVGLPCPLAEKLLSTHIHRFGHRLHSKGVHRATKSYSLPHPVAGFVRLVAPLARLPPIRGSSVESKRRAAGRFQKGGNRAWGVAGRDYNGDGDGDGDGDDYNSSSKAPAWPWDCGSVCHEGRGISPGVLAAQYAIPPHPADQYMYGSVAIASFQEEFWLKAGLQGYANTCGLDAKKFVVTSQYGAENGQECVSEEGEEYGLCQESMMDVQLTKAMAGNVPLSVFYHGEYSIEQWAMQLNAMADGVLPLVHSVSYGDDEIDQGEDAAMSTQFADMPKLGSGSGAEYMHAIDFELMKLGVRGVTVLFAAGDQGAWGRSGVLDGSKFHADYPSASPWATSVGGTDLKVADYLGEERAWDSGGGGFSGRAPMPDYQRSTVRQYLKSMGGARKALPPQGMYNPANRAYPDLSALGGTANPYCVMVNPKDGFMGISGTSASCPVVAGIVARLNDARLREGLPPMGFINPFLYANPEAFNDVTWGENKEAGFVGFHAAEGWDPATGLGTPIYPKLHDAAMAAGRAVNSSHQLKQQRAALADRASRAAAIA